MVAFYHWTPFWSINYHFLMIVTPFPYSSKRKLSVAWCVRREAVEKAAFWRLISSIVYLYGVHGKTTTTCGVY